LARRRRRVAVDPGVAVIDDDVGGGGGGGGSVSRLRTPLSEAVSSSTSTLLLMDDVLDSLRLAQLQLVAIVLWAVPLVRPGGLAFFNPSGSVLLVPFPSFFATKNARERI
jgi:hypothetical protein